jgi:uncharacterized membrane protein YciS (DUF1049 family)
MNFSKEVSKLVTNKYFLYFIVFLAGTNVFAYLVTNNTNAIVFFALVGLLTYQFSKNMAIVLLIALIATNFMMAGKQIKEGLENNESSEKDEKDEKDEKEKMKKKEDSPSLTAVSEYDNDIADAAKELSDEPEGFGEKMGSAKSGSKKPYIDTAATMNEAYKNLQGMLGKDGIKGLHNDTKELMQQQKELFNVMNEMAPALEGAHKMLDKLDMGSISNMMSKLAPNKQ